ncbi:hypothetical protein RHMOL_Rhmol10G0305700 [Rhododendron molle]|uniref:Uncharacterized protein n=1 Tax=Rhododendron molle TaxID=49168 RepID=A0ACC0M7Y1_RHOML|nr:hypothetical protein RHMOL_Rhmol10G0305700 [Rhododendron molle]
MGLGLGRRRRKRWWWRRWRKPTRWMLGVGMWCRWATKLRWSERLIVLVQN